MPQHTYYVMGQWNATCDQCGRVFKSGDIRLRWDNARVCDACFEIRQPQDFVRAIKDDPSVPWSRPWVPNFGASLGDAGSPLGVPYLGESTLGN